MASRYLLTVKINIMDYKVFQNVEQFKSFFLNRGQNNEECFEGVVVTPDIGSFLIGQMSSKQRRVSASQVAYLQKQIEQGFWRPSVATLKVDTNAKIDDGQHRLLAAIKSGKAVNFILQFGFLPSDIHIIDSGIKARTLTDIASMYYPNAKYIEQIPPVFRFQHEFEGERIGSAAHAANRWSSAGPDEFLKWVENNPDIFEFITESERLRSSGDRLLSGKVFNGLKWIMDKLNKDESDRFFTRLSNGVGILENDPVFTLRKVLIRQKTDLTAQRLSGRRLVIAIIHCWNKHINGEELKVLNVPKDTPVIEF